MESNSKSIWENKQRVIESERARERERESERAELQLLLLLILSRINSSANFNRGRRRLVLRNGARQRFLNFKGRKHRIRFCLKRETWMTAISLNTNDRSGADEAGFCLVLVSLFHLSYVRSYYVHWSAAQACGSVNVLEDVFRALTSWSFNGRAIGALKYIKKSNEKNRNRVVFL